MSSSQNIDIALIPGDGIGTEVMPEGVRVLEAAAAKAGLQLNFKEFDWSCETYLSTGRMMPEDGIDQIRPLADCSWPTVAIRRDWSCGAVVCQ
jgi:isocitrate/isopropylmalate dehydrogenase